MNRPDFSKKTGFSRRQWLQTSGASLAGLVLGSRVAPAIAATPTPAPVSLIRLTLNENPFGPSPRVVEAISRDLSTLSRYTTSDEAAALVRQIAAYEDVPVEHIILGEVLEPLGLSLGLQGGPNGEFIYSVPGYNALVDAAKPAGGKPIAVPLDANLRDDLPGLRAKINPHTRALFLVHPHNPSGTVHDPGELKDFIREISKQTLVIVDEAYLEFTEDFSVRTATDLVKAGGNVIVFRTFSKAYGLAALPLGYAVAPKAIVADLTRAGIGGPRSLNRLAVAAAAAALADQTFIASVRAQVKTEREAWFALFRELKVRYTEAQGNFVFFETHRPHREYAAALLTHGVDIGRAFPPLDTWARISIGLPDENARARDAVRRV